ncbi:MAG TPA: hypothetical protein VJA22_00430, partial [Patescibacteria group bacterium]|nr:hypothetical protein [Patescibacteria group bacterium]
MKTSIDRFIPLLLIAVIITSQLISFVHPDSTAAQTTEVDPNYKVYSEFAPAVTVDGNKNSIIVWQDPHTREIKAQKMNKDSIHVWQQNVILANPIGVAD